MSSIDGRISSVDFVESAKFFARAWSEASESGSGEDLRWIWCNSAVEPFMHHMAPGFLAMRNVPVRTAFCELSQGLHSPRERCDEEEADPMLTMEEAQGDRGAAGGYHLYDYHVVYSTSYGVPMLLMRGYHADGQPTTAEEVRRDMGTGTAHGAEDGGWSFLSQTEHPHLHQPWFGYHPCETAPRMALLLRTAADDSSGWGGRVEQHVACRGEVGSEGATNPSTGEVMLETSQGLGLGHGTTSSPTFPVDPVTRAPAREHKALAACGASTGRKPTAVCRQYLLSWFSLMANTIGLAAPLAAYKSALS